MVQTHTIKQKEAKEALKSCLEQISLKSEELKAKFEILELPNEEISPEDSYLDKKNKDEDDLEAFGEDEDDY
jgi:hypothetical protein